MKVVDLIRVEVLSMVIEEEKIKFIMIEKVDIFVILISFELIMEKFEDGILKLINFID